MVSKEIVLSVESYCNEHQVSRESRLKELNLPTSQYYHSKRKYLEQEMHQLESEGKFLELGSTHQSTFKSKQQKSKETIQSGYITIDLRLPTGVEMRIQGDLSTLHLKELLTNL